MDVCDETMSCDLFLCFLCSWLLVPHSRQFGSRFLYPNLFLVSFSLVFINISLCNLLPLCGVHFSHIYSGVCSPCQVLLDIFLVHILHTIYCMSIIHNVVMLVVCKVNVLCALFCTQGILHVCLSCSRDVCSVALEVYTNQPQH